MLLAKAGGHGPVERPRRRWEHNIKMNLKGVGRAALYWINMAQDMDKCRSVVDKVINLGSHYVQQIS